ncbi:hypothetical protein Hanom_Chr06g00502361 [Helianthus anomalus]
MPATCSTICLTESRSPSVTGFVLQLLIINDWLWLLAVKSTDTKQLSSPRVPMPPVFLSTCW